MQSTAERVDHLEAEIVELSSRMNAAEYLFLRRIRELEDIIQLLDWTYPQWLAWRCNMSTKTVYERLRVARALDHLPAISAAFAEGRLSYSKVRIVTRMAAPATDAEYLQNALGMSVHQLEVLVAKHKKVSTGDAEKQVRDRFVQIYEDDDGTFVLRGRLAPDDAAVLLKALAAAEPAQSKVDALVQVAAAAVDRLATGDDVSLHVVNDVSTHNDDCHCEVEGIAIAKTTADRLCCENPLNRSVSSRQRRMLMLRQGGVCGFPGCTHRRYLHGHHIVHWADGGRTTLDNLCLICSKHHRLLHEGRFTIDHAGIVRDRHGFIIENSPRQRRAEPDLRSVVSSKTDTRGRDVWDGSGEDWDSVLYAMLRAAAQNH